MDDQSYRKYLKYKNKYMGLKNMLMMKGGAEVDLVVSSWNLLTEKWIHLNALAGDSRRGLGPSPSWTGYEHRSDTNRYHGLAIMVQQLMKDCDILLVQEFDNNVKMILERSIPDCDIVTSVDTQDDVGVIYRKSRFNKLYSKSFPIIFGSSRKNGTFVVLKDNKSGKEIMALSVHIPYLTNRDNFETHIVPIIFNEIAEARKIYPNVIILCGGDWNMDDESMPKTIQVVNQSTGIPEVKPANFQNAFKKITDIIHPTFISHSVPTIQKAIDNIYVYPKTITHVRTPTLETKYYNIALQSNYIIWLNVIGSDGNIKETDKLLNKRMSLPRNGKDIPGSWFSDHIPVFSLVKLPVKAGHIPVESKSVPLPAVGYMPTESKAPTALHIPMTSLVKIEIPNAITITIHQQPPVQEYKANLIYNNRKFGYKYVNGSPIDYNDSIQKKIYSEIVQGNEDALIENVERNIDHYIDLSKVLQDQNIIDELKNTHTASEYKDSHGIPPHDVAAYRAPAYPLPAYPPPAAPPAASRGYAAGPAPAYVTAATSLAKRLNITKQENFPNAVTREETTERPSQHATLVITPTSTGFLFEFEYDSKYSPTGTEKKQYSAIHSKEIYDAILKDNVSSIRLLNVGIPPHQRNHTINLTNIKKHVI